MKRKLTMLLTVLPLLLVAGSNDLSDEGVGTYTDASVGNQISNFTINRQMVSCGVGTVGFAGGGFGLTGPFAMLMYAKDIHSYSADHNTKTIRASGRMRSITVVGGVPVEDVVHDFLAIAVDNAGTGRPDRFDVHFTTPFWGASPMCTPSTEVQGWCRFGGELLLGDVTVGP